MAQARYIIRMANGELFGWNPDWLKIPGMVEYDPAIHGYRSEVAAQMGLVDPSAKVVPPVEVSKPAVAVAGNKKPSKAPAAVEPAPAQAKPAESKTSDMFSE